ncbi:MAG: protein kinase [Rhodococcus sp. (in: high G+C Gram-positive bacteria)]|nr:MAG: protein kinase [Rhodococcus sp. (in: high G+C Gram-positive bacteria)]
MNDVDPFATQRDVSGSVGAELAAAGFEDAQEIGRGGFGVVYRCTQVSLDRTVAVKVLTADLDEQNRARFLREQRAAGRLTGHPNIVNVLHVDTTANGRPFIVMPYLAQGSLGVRIQRDGPLPLDEALRLGVKMAGALETAHRFGILHRDVKPGNILFTDYGEPALTDFGIAHFAGGFETTSGIVTGSPAFTAPEVVAGKPPSPAADVYGLGATLFAALTGRAAFERRSGEQLMAQLLRITAEPAPDPREHGLDEDISTIIDGAMSSDPQNRPTTVELGQQLEASQLRHGFPADAMALHTEPGTMHEDTPSPQVDSSSAVWASDGRWPSRSPFNLRRTGGLPLELTSFVDRSTELAEAKNLLSSSRLVTLTGVGGVGKTRVALRVAANTQDTFEDGVWLIELGELHDASLLPDTIDAVMGLREHSRDSPLEILAEHLADRHALLVLDNCEHLVAAVAALTETLLRRCPHLYILATSREFLNIGGEAVLRLPPLTVPDPARPDSLRTLPKYDAVTLFVQRAEAAVPGFVLSEENRTAVTRICQLLYGLPLAIELAAARLRVLSPQQILDRLDDRLRLLTAGVRVAPSRQQTLRLSIEWSYDLCTPAERQLWSLLSVFVGGVELDAAEFICVGYLEQEDVLDVLAGLVDKSILIREGTGAAARYRLLEGLRDYGSQKLHENGEQAALRRRHRDWYQQLVLRAESEWIGPHQLEWSARLKREQPNMREALQFCVAEPGEAEVGLQIAAALYTFWLTHGLLSEGRCWLDRMLAQRTGPPSIEQIKALSADSVLAAIQADLSTSAILAEQAHARAEELGGESTHAIVTHTAGLQALFAGDSRRAIDYFEGALGAFRAEGDLLRLIEGLVGLELASGLLGDIPRAIACKEEVVGITELHGESVQRAYSLSALGLAVWQTDHELATSLLRQSLRLTRLVEHHLTSAWSLEALAWIAAAEHLNRRAAVLLGSAASLAQTAGSSVVPLPNLLVYHDDSERAARRVLGAHAFNAEVARGAALSFDEAVAYALHDDQDLPHGTRIGDAATLTKREWQVAELVAEGLTNRAIADKLVISPRTAQGHVEHVLTKLGFTSRAQIAAWVVEQSTN